MAGLLLSRLKQQGNNIEEYLTRFEQDSETCEMLISLFFSEVTLDNYLDALDKKDYTKAYDEIHSIKGSAANVGLTLISNKAKEVMAKIETGDSAMILACSTELINIFAHTRETVKNSE